MPIQTVRSPWSTTKSDSDDKTSGRFSPGVGSAPSNGKPRASSSSSVKRADGDLGVQQPADVKLETHRQEINHGSR